MVAKGTGRYCNFSGQVLNLTVFFELNCCCSWVAIFLSCGLGRRSKGRVVILLSCTFNICCVNPSLIAPFSPQEKLFKVFKYYWEQEGKCSVMTFRSTGKNRSSWESLKRKKLTKTLSKEDCFLCLLGIGMGDSGGIF